MKTIGKFIKATIIGGLIFLVPLVALIIILTKAFEIMLKVAQPLNDMIPMDKIGSVAIADIIVIMLILLICFIAGLLASRDFFKKIRHDAEQKILLKIPGYAFVKGITNSMKSSEEASEHFLPVLVRFDDCEQLGYEIERVVSGKVVVYLPGSPNPWSGVTIYMDADRIKSIDISVPESLTIIKQLGFQSSRLFDK